MRYFLVVIKVERKGWVEGGVQNGRTVVRGERKRERVGSWERS